MGDRMAALAGKTLSPHRHAQILAHGKWLQGVLKGFSFDGDALMTAHASPVVLPYGSVVSGTSFADGDADYTVSFPITAPDSTASGARVIERERQEKVLSEVFAHIKRQNKDAELQPQRIFRARVPIVQYARKGDGGVHKFDLSLSLDGLKNSLLLREYMASDARLRLGVLGAKQWGRENKILNARRGWISPYALTIMYIHFMKQSGRTSAGFEEDQITRRVHEIVAAAAKSDGDLTEMTEFASTLPLHEADISTVERDIYDFFAFYGDPDGFDFDTAVVDIRSSNRFSSKDQWSEAIAQLDEKERWHLLGHEVILLRDPFEPHSLGRSVDFFRGEEIREKFRTAASKKEPLTFFRV